MSNLTKNLLYNWLKVHFLAVQSFFFFFLILFIYCWLLWAFVALVSGVVALQLLIAVSSHWRAWAHSKQAQELWHTCSVVPRQVESSQTRDQSHVPCIGRWILNHRTTREVQIFIWFIWLCQVLVAAQRIFSCGMWDLAPWPGIELEAPALGAES